MFPELQGFAHEVALLPTYARLMLAALIGLPVGSFITVVAHRLPIMLERAWAQEEGKACAGTYARYNLCVPRSACPSCGHVLRPWENIPLLGYAMLRGRCGGCRAPIARRYIVIEILSAALIMTAVWHFGVTGKAFCAYLFAAVLLALAVIDAETGLLPDALTLPLMVVGLAVNAAGVFVPLHDAVLGMIAGYGLLGLAYLAARAFTGKEGFGLGDLKLLGALGAWLGFAAMSQVFLLSFLAAAAYGVFALMRRERAQEDSMPFGPFIALAGFFTMFVGTPLNSWAMT